MTEPDFGQDAPGLLRAFLIVAAAGSVVAGVVALSLEGAAWSRALAAGATVVAVYGLGMAALMRRDSRVTKITVRDRLLGLVPWRGDEQVLDIGCGRGLWLVGTAQRLPRGQVTGIDVWRASDQSANTPDAALGNARALDVADRVTARTADMRALPFPDTSFDAVVSGWAVHNVEPAADRTGALTEAARVLRPGGWLILSDIACREEYLATLPRVGFTDLRTVDAGLADRLRGMVSFGSYRPFAIIARRA